MKRRGFLKNLFGIGAAVGVAVKGKEKLEEIEKAVEESEKEPKPQKKIDPAEDYSWVYSLDPPQPQRWVYDNTTDPHWIRGNDTGTVPDTNWTTVYGDSTYIDNPGYWTINHL